FKVHDTKTDPWMDKYNTNNEMEYIAVETCIKDNENQWNPGDTVVINTDSKLIVEQLMGRWGVRKPHLIPFNERVKEQVYALFNEGIKIFFVWIPREQSRAGHILEDFVKQDYKYKKGKRIHLKRQQVVDILNEDNMEPLEAVKRIFKECLSSEVIWF
ncbi:MAG: hypothetical protein ACRDFC_04150, partial [Ignavibacteria bacterium]